MSQKCCFFKQSCIKTSGWKLSLQMWMRQWTRGQRRICRHAPIAGSQGTRQSQIKGRHPAALLTQNCRSTDCQMVSVCSYISRSAKFGENRRAKNAEMSFGLYTVGTHTHTHTDTNTYTRLLINSLQRSWWLSDPTPPIMVTLRAHSAGRLRGMNLLLASFEKFIEVLNREMRWMPDPSLFLCIRRTLHSNGPLLHFTLLHLGASFTFSFLRQQNKRREVGRATGFYLSVDSCPFLLVFISFSSSSGKNLSFLLHISLAVGNMIALHRCTLVRVGVN